MTLPFPKEAIPPELKVDFPTLQGLSDDEALGVLVRGLESAPGDKNAPSIVGLDPIQSINDMIDHLRTPEGLKFLSLYRRLSVIVAGLDDGKRSGPAQIIKRCERTFAALWNHK